MNLRIGQHVTATIVPNGGIQAGSAKFATDVDGIVTVEQNPDNELEATVTAIAVGSVSLTASVDGDQDTGDDQVNTLTAVGAISVLQADSTAIELQFGTPE